MSNESVKISVLMPVYNTHPYELRAAIESILNQTFADFEFIIINDGSTDNNIDEVVYSFSDERIKYLKNETNLKLIATLNKGIDHSAGKYIARIDADDYCAPERLEKQFNYMEEHPDIGVLGTLFEFVPNNFNWEQITGIDELNSCIRYIPGCLLHSSAMIRKSILRENRIYYDKNCLHAEDFKMWSDITRFSKAALLPEILTYYRISNDGICASNRRFQNKMLMCIALENMIKDFECDKDLMYNALEKFKHDIPLPAGEYDYVKNFLSEVKNKINANIPDKLHERISVYIDAILNHFYNEEDAPVVSVLMSVYNARENELRQSVESILNQTFTDFEFIIINDGSTNNVEEVILSYNDKRIRYYKNETNLKIIASVNRGLKLCRGKYIARLDADDYSAPARLEKQVAYMEAHPNVGGLGTFFKRLHTGEEVHLPTKIQDVTLLTRYVKGCISNPSGMIRRSVIVENNLEYNKGCLHAEDFKFWADLSYYSDLAVIPEVLTFIRSHEDGVSKSNKAYQNKMVIVVLLDNIIKDFECDKNYLYSILIKYIKGLPISGQELDAMGMHFVRVIRCLLPKVSDIYKPVVKHYILSILRHFIVEKE